MTERNQLYNQLPETFSPKDALDKVHELDFEKDFMKNRSWIQSVLDAWLFSKQIERVEHGRYRKLQKDEV